MGRFPGFASGVPENRIHVTGVFRLGAKRSELSHREWVEGHVTIPMALRAPTVPSSDVENIVGQVDVLPAQRAELTVSQACIGGHKEYRSERCGSFE